MKIGNFGLIKKKKGILVKTKNGFNISKPIEVLMPIKNKLSVSFNIEVHE